MESRCSRRRYMARILIRDPAAYRQQRASQEGLKTLKEQHENLHELKTQDKAIVRALRREAEEQAVKEVEDAAANGRRRSLRIRSAQIVAAKMTLSQP